MKSISELKEEVKSFHMLSENWDGYGAIPATIECVDNTILILDKLESSNMIGKISDIYPNTHGTISIDFDIMDKEYLNQLSLETGMNSFAYFVIVGDTRDDNWRGPIFKDNKKINDADIDELLSYLKQL